MKKRRQWNNIFKMHKERKKNLSANNSQPRPVTNCSRIHLSVHVVLSMCIQHILPIKQMLSHKTNITAFKISKIMHSFQSHWIKISNQ